MRSQRRVGRRSSWKQDIVSAFPSYEVSLAVEYLDSRYVPRNNGQISHVGSDCIADKDNGEVSHNQD